MMATIVCKFEVDRVAVAAEGIEEEEVDNDDNSRETEDEEVEFSTHKRIRDSES